MSHTTHSYGSSHTTHSYGRSHTTHSYEMSYVGNDVSPLMRLITWMSPVHIDPVMIWSFNNSSSFRTCWCKSPHTISDANMWAVRWGDNGSSNGMCKSLNHVQYGQNLFFEGSKYNRVDVHGWNEKCGLVWLSQKRAHGGISHVSDNVPPVTRCPYTIWNESCQERHFTDDTFLFHMIACVILGMTCHLLIHTCDNTHQRVTFPYIQIAFLHKWTLSNVKRFFESSILYSGSKCIWTEILFTMNYTWAWMRTHTTGGGHVDEKNDHCQNFLQCFGPNQRSPGWVGPTNYIWNPHVVNRFSLELLRKIHHRPRMENSNSKRHELSFSGMVNMVIVLTMPRKWIYLYYC